jgi:hypothetical protein
LQLPVNADIELHKTGPLVPWSPVIPVEMDPIASGGDTVDSVVTETIAPSATKAAKTASLIRELRWRFVMLVRWFMSSSLVLLLVQERGQLRT